MPTKDLASFQVKYLQILDKEGTPLSSDYKPPYSNEQLKEFFRQMVLIREIDIKAVNLQRQGRIGTYPPVEGEEACQVGSASLLHDEDWVFPAFRELGVFLVRGAPLHRALLYFMGCEDGNLMEPAKNIFPVSVPVASQLPIGVGAAMALKTKQKPGVVVTYFSDGATSEGDFAEALNFASVYQTPNIFICQNNQWAISVPREQQTASQTLAQKALAYDMAQMQVDGNDLLAVLEASAWALERARSGKGPSFLELVTYRRRMHTTADDPKKYQDAAAHEEWLKNDPVTRYENFLLSRGIIDDAYKQSIQAEVDPLVKSELEKADEIIKAQTIEGIFKNTYAEMPPHLECQLGELKSFAKD